MGKSKEIQKAKESAKTAQGGAGKKKKWTKGRTKEKSDNSVLFNQKLMARLLKEVPKMKVITITKVADALGITGTLAKLGIRHLEKEGLIQPVIKGNKMIVYTKLASTKDDEVVVEKKDKKAKKEEPKKEEAKKEEDE